MIQNNHLRSLNSKNKFNLLWLSALDTPPKRVPSFEIPCHGMMVERNFKLNQVRKKEFSHCSKLFSGIMLQHKQQHGTCLRETWSNFKVNPSDLPTSTKYLLLATDSFRPGKKFARNLRVELGNIFGFFSKAFEAVEAKFKR